MIEYKDVSVNYPGGIDALHNVTLTLETGERIGLIGANGAGKSTLMKAALGLVATEGGITVDGEKITKKTLPAIRKKLGFVLQDSDAQMFMPTVLDDMVFGPMNYGVKREDAEKTAEQTLKKLGAEYLLTRHNHRISGGEKKLAAIATVLAMEPDAVLMDEPTASLDPRNRRRLIEVINSIGGTVIIATHDLDMVLDTCDRVILLNAGRIVADGKTEDILSDGKLLEDNGLELPLSLTGRTGK